ncbi:phage holin family protein, partial [Acinetobacter baumannii]
SRHEGKPVESAKLSRSGEKLSNKAMGTLVLWIVGVMLDGASNTGYALPAAYLGYEIAVEAWSIFENMARCGDALPDFITARLKRTM